jgi:hypothetical protein
MAKSRAQQAAIAVSMKKAGNKPKSLPKAQKGLSTKNTMYNFNKIYTGPDSTDPGVLKAKADKKKADTNLLLYKKKVDAQKQKLIKKSTPKKKR